MNHYNSCFGFILNWGEIGSMTDVELIKNYSDLIILLTDDSHSDIDTNDLFTELKMSSIFISSNAIALEALQNIY